MKKLLAVFIVFFVAILFSSSLIAAEKIKIRLITGEIAAIDPAANSMTVKKRLNDLILTTNEKTVVIINKTQRQLTEVKIGDKVRVKYSETEGKALARSIEVTPQKNEGVTGGMPNNQKK
ncbi:MAG: hypothetical protein EPN22_16200 [Nitrospirae bacterium]|nr:MAG: hypothetical protein EPN22_16200 [Nitrospirota bacterium]